LAALPGTGSWLGDGVVYFFSLLGFFLAPAALGRGIWLLPLWFAGLNLFLLLTPVPFHPGQNPMVFLALAHLPWIAFCLDLAGRGKAAAVLEFVPMQALLLWSAFRLMGVHCILALPTGELPPAFAFETAAGEAITALGALVLWAGHRSQSAWYRGLLLFWNAYGLTSALAIFFRMTLANPDLPLLRLSPDIHRHLTSLPQSWGPFFWVPIGICIHVAVFFKLYLEWNAASRTLGNAVEVPQS
jgi:hypothetical protein